jgi:hypothetical protein
MSKSALNVVLVSTRALLNEGQSELKKVLLVNYYGSWTSPVTVVGLTSANPGYS